MSLASLRVLESASEASVRVLGLRYHPSQKGWSGLVDTTNTPYSNLTVKATPEEALVEVLPHRGQHEVGPCTVEPASLADLKVLEAVSGDIEATGIDYTPGMGWGWTFDGLLLENSAAMGFTDTPEEALAELVTFLTHHKNALPA